MAASWLIMALRLDNVAASALAEDVWPGPMVAGQNGRRVASDIASLLEACAGGSRIGNLWTTVLDDAGTKSTGNVACTQANAAGNTVVFTYGAKVITLTEGTTGENGFARGASDTTCAANLAACINAHSTLGKLFTALGAVGNCGLTSKVGTELIQGFALTTDDATAFAFTQMTGATEGAAQYMLQHHQLQRTPT